MSTKLYNGMKADITTMSDMCSLQKDLQNLVEKYYAGKLQEIVVSTYKECLKMALKEKNIENIFAPAFASEIGVFVVENLQELEKFNRAFNNNLKLAESFLKDLNYDDEKHARALLLVAVSETVQNIVAKYEMNRVTLSENNELNDLKTVVFVYPMTDKCLLYPIDSVFEDKGGSHYLYSEMLAHPLVEDYHYQNNSDMPEDVTEEQWEKRIEDWDIALDVENNPLGFLSKGMRIEASNINAISVNSFIMSKNIEELIDSVLLSVNFEKIEDEAVNDLIFKEEFFIKKINPESVSATMNRYTTFKKNKEEYRKQYESLQKAMRGKF